MRLIFQAVGGTLDLSHAFDELDCVISCAPKLVGVLRHQGVHAHHSHHALDSRILEHLSPGGPVAHEVTFAGSLVADPGVHAGRQALLTRGAAECPTEIFTPALACRASRRLGPKRLGRSLAGPVQFAVARGLPASLVQRIPMGRGLLDLRLSRAIESRLRPAVYGLDMYEVFRRSRISLNVHSNSSPTRASNLRLYEVTGVGSCLLTDWRANLPDLFEPDRDVVTCRTPGECVEKVRWLLVHVAAPAVSTSGQARAARRVAGGPGVCYPDAMRGGRVT